MEPTYYHFNNSQDVVFRQTQFSLFKRVLNIVFSLELEKGFDKALMTQAFEKLYERNDCLRLTMVRRGKERLQYFAPERHVGKIPEVDFKTAGEMDRYIRCFRRKPTNLYKGDALRVVYGTNPDGRQIILCKVSHYVADTYGIGILVNDLLSVYEALREGTPLPPAPGSFETLLAQDNQFRGTTESVERDRAFFNDYFRVKHPTRPFYCGLHGNGSDKWLKLKAKGKPSVPYVFVRCDTEGFRFVLPSSLVKTVRPWCEENAISFNTFFFYTFGIACSLLNDRAPSMLPLELLNCRGTLAEKKAAGTKVQSLAVCLEVDYKRSFAENIARMDEEQKELYRHTRLSYLEVQALHTKVYDYSQISQLYNYTFSYIPVSFPEGVKLQVHSNGKGALIAYVALMHDVMTDEIVVVYDIQTRMISPSQLIEFQNTWVHVMEKVVSAPDQPLEEVFPA